MNLAWGKGFMNKRGLPPGPGRAQVLPAFSLSLGGNTPSWGGVNRLLVRPRPGGVIPKPPIGESQVGYLQGSSEMPGLSSKGTLEAVPSNVS